MKKTLPLILYLTCLLTLLTACTSGTTHQTPSEMLPGIRSQPLGEIEHQLPNAHPVNYMIFAMREYKAGHKSQAIFWYYVGLIRYRFYLLANPDLPLGGDPALYASMRSVVGAAINRYAGGHIDETVQQINAALNWDASHKNGFTSKTGHATAWRKARSQMIKFTAYLADHKGYIHKQREANGIAYDETGGVGIREPMPSDWPPLKASTSLNNLAGQYDPNGKSLWRAVFFSKTRAKLFRATSFKLQPQGSNTLVVTAWEKQTLLQKRTIHIAQKSGAIIFKQKDPGSRQNHIPPTITVISLRINTAGQLVLQRDIYDEYADKPKPTQPTYTFWNRALRLVVPTSQ